MIPKYEFLKEVRWRGLMMGIEFGSPKSLTLKAAWLMDTVGVKGAQTEISAIKVVAARAATDVIDRAIQVFGGAGVSGDWPLADMYAHARTLHLVDGPDDVHLMQIARRELGRFADGLEVLLRDPEQRAAEVVGHERGDRGQQHPERLDEPLGDPLRVLGLLVHPQMYRGEARIQNPALIRRQNVPKKAAPRADRPHDLGIFRERDAR